MSGAPLAYWGGISCVIGLSAYMAAVVLSILRLLLWLEEPFRLWIATVIWSRGPRRPTSSQVTVGTPMGCFKAFYGSNWVKCDDKQGFILRFELVVNGATDFVANKSLSNLQYLTRLGQTVCRRLERTCLTAVSSPIRARAYKSDQRLELGPRKQLEELAEHAAESTHG